MNFKQSDDEVLAILMIHTHKRDTEEKENQTKTFKEAQTLKADL